MCGVAFCTNMKWLGVNCLVFVQTCREICNGNADGPQCCVGLETTKQLSAKIVALRGNPRTLALEIVDPAEFWVQVFNFGSKHLQSGWTRNIVIRKKLTVSIHKMGL